MTLLAPALRFERPGAGGAAAGSSDPALGFTRAPVWCGFDAAIAGGVLLWCLGFAWLRLALSPAIGVDDAEILVLGDGLRLGYHPERPPLYNWLAVLAGQAFGPGLATLVALKYTLLGLAGLHYYAAARRLLSRPALAAAATGGLLTFFHLGYQPHVGFTHSIALIWVLAATLHLLLAMSERRSGWHYLALGLLLGLGLLAKQSFPAFLLALLAALWATRPLRPLLRDPRAWFSLLLALALFLPWLLWALEHRLARPSAAPFEPWGFLASRAEGLLVYGAALAQAVAATLALLAACFAWPLRRLDWRTARQAPRLRFAARLVLYAALAMALFAAATGATWLKDRHLHVVFLFLPLLAFALLEAAGGATLRAWRLRVYALVVLTAAAGAAWGVVWTVAKPPPDCNKCRFQKPLERLVAEFEARGLTEGTLLAADDFAAAQVGSRLPGLRVISADYAFFHPAPNAAESRPRCLLLWPAELKPAAFARFQGLVEASRGQPWPADLESARLSLPAPRNPEVHYAWDLAVLPAAGDCR